MPTIAGFGQQIPAQTLLVLSKGDQTLAVVDPATLKVLSRTPVGNDPHEVIASTNGRYAYVSNYGFGAFHTLAVVDLTTHAALPPIDLGPLSGPHGLVFVGGKTWFTAEGAKTIGRYDPVSKRVDWIMGTGQNRTHMLWVSKDLNTIYTTNVSSATVSIIQKTNGPDFPLPPPMPPGQQPERAIQPRRPPPPHSTANNWTETVIPVGRGSEGFDVSPDGKEIWVGNAQDGTVSIIDTGAKQVTQTLPADYQGVNRLKFTPDGKMVFISGSGVAILDAATRQRRKRLDLGHCAGIQMQPDGSRAYVACSGENGVTVIDLKTLDVTGHINAGPEPDGLAWAQR